MVWHFLSINHRERGGTTTINKILRIEVRCRILTYKRLR